jgi:hypothetical protein
MPQRIVARWTDWSGHSSEHLVLTQHSGSIVAESVIISGADEGYVARYRITCDPSWRVRQADIELIGDERTVRLTSDGRDQWLDTTGNVLAHLDGAIDIDLTASPFTNTLPIRRLSLRPGQSADISVAYVSFPDLTVTSDPQRYTCIDRRRYRFEALASGFVREIDVDDDGLVVHYLDLFRRVL